MNTKNYSLYTKYFGVFDGLKLFEVWDDISNTIIGLYVAECKAEAIRQAKEMLDGMKTEKIKYILKRACPNIHKEIGDCYAYEYSDSIKDLLAKGIIEEYSPNYKPSYSESEEEFKFPF